MRLELTRSCDHYPLKVACIPISPPAREHFFVPRTGLEPAHLAACAREHFFVPRTGLEPAHLAACAPETHASTNSAIWAKKKSGKRDSNSRPRPWQGRALPTELFPQSFYYKSKIIAFNFRKRVQRYCFFLTYANFSAFFLHFFAFSVILFCACARPFLLIFII